MKTHTLKDVVAAFRAEYNAEADKAKAATKARAAALEAIQAELFSDAHQFAGELVPLIEGKTWSIDRSDPRQPTFTVHLPNRPEPLISIRVSRYPSAKANSYEVKQPYINRTFTDDRGEALVLAAKIIGQQLAREDQAK